MPRYNINAKLAQQELAQRQDAQDSTDTASMVDMLSKLYGVQQQQQLAPEHLRALQLANANDAAMNPLRVQQAQSGIDLTNAQTKDAQNRASDKFTPREIADMGARGVALDPYYGTGLLPDGVEQKHNAAHAAALANHWKQWVGAAPAMKNWSPEEEAAVTNEFNPESLDWLKSQHREPAAAQQPGFWTDLRNFIHDPISPDAKEMLNPPVLQDYMKSPNHKAMAEAYHNRYLNKK